jgi:hypothetical protein
MRARQAPPGPPPRGRFMDCEDQTDLDLDHDPVEFNGDEDVDPELSDEADDEYNEPEDDPDAADDEVDEEALELERIPDDNWGHDMGRQDDDGFPDEGRPDVDHRFHR